MTGTWLVETLLESEKKFKFPIVVPLLSRELVFLDATKGVVLRILTHRRLDMLWLVCMPERLVKLKRQVIVSSPYEC